MGLHPFLTQYHSKPITVIHTQEKSVTTPHFMSMQTRIFSTVPSRFIFTMITLQNQTISLYQDLLLSIFANDAIYTTGAGEAHAGKEAITKWAEPVMNAGPPTFTHNNTSILVEATEDGAKGRGYWIVLDTSEPQPKILVHGHYIDTFARTPEGWRSKTRGSMRGWSQTRWATESKSTAF